MEFVDIAGLVKGASKGEGLGNKFLGNIRECDAIVHVVRCFEGTDIVHVEGNVDPVRDIETIDTELILSDLEVVSNRAARMAKAGKTGDKKALASAAWLSALEEHLGAGKNARTFPLDEADEDQVLQMREMGLLTAKPVIYAANMSEDDLMEGMLGNPHYQTVKKAGPGRRRGVHPHLCQNRGGYRGLHARGEKRNSWRRWALRPRAWTTSSRPATACWDLSAF